ncbi:MAG: rhodanese-like domain-containing protein [Alphaproteobacteria bacterium]|nr:rhodanese-like domain-containing protein [Alphaproteobacteria bacterium]
MSPAVAALAAGGALGRGYAGDISPRAAWDILLDNVKAVLVDVRTTAEWAYVGTPDLRALGRKPVFIEWQSFPTMEINIAFRESLGAELAARGVDRSTPILMLCRSGARSRAAAAEMTAAGYTAAYNVEGGFEGDRDAEGHRGTSNGWKAEGLPWVQS